MTMTITTIIGNTVIDITGGLLLLIDGDDDDVVAADDKAPAVATDTGAGSGRHTLDEAIGGIVETSPMSLVWRHVTRANSNERANSDGRACAHVETLRNGWAVIVKNEVVRRGDRGHGQRCGDGASQQEDGSASPEHIPGQAGFGPTATPPINLD